MKIYEIENKDEERKKGKKEIKEILWKKFVFNVNLFFQVMLYCKEKKSEYRI